MIKKFILATFISSSLLSNLAMAAPQVQVPPAEFQASFDYTLSKNQETYNEDWGSSRRKVNGHSQDYDITYGLRCGYAVSLTVDNYRFDPFDDGLGQLTTPSMDTVDLSLQKKLSRNFAIITGVRHVSGSWTYSDSSYTPSSVTSNTSSQNIAEIGVIGEANLSNKVQVYTSIKAGHDLREYKIGLTGGPFDIGYQYAQYTNLYNPVFIATGPPINSLDLTSKGLYFGFTQKF